MDLPSRIPAIGDGDSLEAVRADATRLDIIGARGGSLAACLHARRTTGPTVVVTSDFREAVALTADLAHFCGDEDAVLLFPRYESGPYDEVVPDRPSCLDRATVLFRLRHRTWQFLVTSADAALRRVPPVDVFDGHCRHLKTGDTVARDGLLATLRLSDYRDVRAVEEPGCCNARGSLVDIFVPAMEQPVRIDFDGDRIEHIHLFSPDTQTRATALEEVWIHPAGASLLPATPVDAERTAERLRERCDLVNFPTSRTSLLIEDMLAGRTFVGSHAFLPALYRQGRGDAIFDYAGGAGLCISDPAAVKMVWSRQHGAFAADYERRIEDGIPAMPPDALLVPHGMLEERAADGRLTVAHPLEVAEAGGLEQCVHPVRIGAQDFSDLRERLQVAAQQAGTEPMEALAADLRRLLDEGWRVSLCAHTDGQVARLRDMVVHRGLSPVDTTAPLPPAPGLFLTKGPLRRGFIWPGEGICCMTDEDIFGARQRASGRRTDARSALFDLRLLDVDDLVIHKEHGVGRYRGLVQKEVNGTTVDFLLIAFRGDDRLYLPVYRVSQIQKYMGASESAPPLDRLGGQTFAKTKATARQRAMELAGSLLHLYARRNLARRPPVAPADDLYAAFEASFPFEETRDQAAVIDEVMADLESEKPMDRLICGDVGFGKTEVAMRAAFRVVASGRQVAILVPTTVLAQQHFDSLKRRFAASPVRVEMLSRFRTPKQNEAVVAGLKDGAVDIVVGTHRLLQPDVHFRRPGLLVIDEEHRFGVSHKERIRSLRASVDTMAMTATPIPRTLHMAFSRLRDLSIIATAPMNRLPIRTVICHDTPGVLRAAIERELARDGQVYVVHNRVRTIHAMAERIAGMIPQAKVAVGHGQMSEERLEEVMVNFVEGRTNVLVCTAIIESGLDIPRANTIIIDRADTFGLAQLYQLRGRVGRSDRQAYACLVVPPLQMLTGDAKERLEALVRHTELGSGFSVASMDLEIRGAGNLLGAEQSGTVDAVGYEMFLDLLQEATARLAGESPPPDREPEITLETPGFLSAEYIPDPGLRLHYYKEMACARSLEEVEETLAALVDRFGPLPLEAKALCAGMTAKVLCRMLGVAGIETTRRRITVHLGPDSRVDPREVSRVIEEADGALRLTPDLRLVSLVEPSQKSPTEAAIHLLRTLWRCAIKSH